MASVFSASSCCRSYAALGASGKVPIQLVYLFVGQLAVSCQHNALMCKFAVHLFTSFQPLRCYRESDPKDSPPAKG